MVPLRSSLAVSFLAIVIGASVEAASLDPLVQKWLGKQTELQTWTADVTQTRHLQSLTQPLISQGKVWFSAPNQFRWQIGQPPATIALRDPTSLVILYPRLKRAERYRLDQTNPLQDTLALLDAGFPRNEQDLIGRFNVLEQNKKPASFELVLQPKAPAARRLLPQLRVIFSPENLSLLATELQFTDGSTMRNEFSAVQLNPELDSGLFETNIPTDYQTVEPALR